MSWTNQTKHSADFDLGLYYLLQEIGDYLLQEDGSKLVLEESTGFLTPTTWTNQSKS
jgi:hypothetical protein